MEDDLEKRGPVEKTAKGWPINPLGVVVLILLVAVAAFFIAKPLISQKLQQQGKITAQLISPSAGQIVREATLPVELSIADSKNVAKVEFWAKTYTDGNWQVIGEDDTPPYRIEWQIPENFRNKAIAVTTHIIDKKGQTTQDPGGWREGIIVLGDK